MLMRLADDTVLAVALDVDQEDVAPLGMGVDHTHVGALDTRLDQQSVVDRKHDLTSDPQPRVVDQQVGRVRDGAFQAVLDRNNGLVRGSLFGCAHHCRDAGEGNRYGTGAMFKRGLFAVGPLGTEIGEPHGRCLVGLDVV